MNQTFYEYLRLAVVAASDAAERETDRIELDPKNSLDKYKKVEGFVKIDGRCRLARFFKNNGEKFIEENGTFYVFNNAYMIKLHLENIYKLKFKYSMYGRKELPIVKKSIEAIMYVLLQLEPNLKLIIEKI